MYGYDYYDIGYRDGFLNRERKSPPDRGQLGRGFTEPRYGFGYGDGRTAARTDWRYAEHDKALAIPLDYVVE